MMTSESCRPFLLPFAEEAINRHNTVTKPVFEEAECAKADALFAPNEKATLELEKTVHYDIPLFHGSCEDNDKHFEKFEDSKYDWERVNDELYHVKEVKKEEAIATKKRAFVHPATGLVHPVPLEWEEDMMMEKRRQKIRRQRQMKADSEVVLSSMNENEVSCVCSKQSILAWTKD